MDKIWKRDEIDSPCVAICLIDPQGQYCLGCGRTKDEIGRWSSMSADERKRVKDELGERLSAISAKRKGGRRKRQR